MRQNKTLTWLQACFLGDVRVILCNSLGDSLFQTYVMNFVEIVIDYYLYINSHVSQTIVSYTHYTSYSLLNFVHDMCVNLLWPSKIICSLILMQNMFNVWVFGDKLVEKLIFGRSGLNLRVFEKLLISNSCISFMKYCALRSFCIKLLYFSKISFFQNFDQSNLSLDRSKMRQKLWFESAWLD